MSRDPVADSVHWWARSSINERARPVLGQRDWVTVETTYALENRVQLLERSLRLWWLLMKFDGAYSALYPVAGERLDLTLNHTREVLGLDLDSDEDAIGG